MAEITPFKGILYNTSKIGNLSDVVTPPFDVISEKERQCYLDRHPQNMIRLILGEPHRTDTLQNSWQARAANFYQKWRSNQILIQDDTPAFYLTALDFSIGSQQITRYGFIALVGLEPFDKKIIIPHEKTFSNIKSERLELMKACHTNFCSIFSLFSDQGNGIMDSLKQSVDHHLADITFFDDLNHQHRLWRITDPQLHNFISEQTKHKKIFIADGHHRYETALIYRTWISQTIPEISSNHPSNRVMMYLTSMEDPGLIILPAHRVLKGLASSSFSTFIEKCHPYFDIATIAFDNGKYQKKLMELMEALQRGASRNTFGAYIKDNQQFYVLALKPGIMKEKFSHELAPVFWDLDVMVLTRLILEEILGFDQAKLDDEKLIDYLNCEKRAIEAVSSGENDLALLMNPTKIHQVRRIAEEGFTMPRKATYFYPKVITGMVLNDLKG